MGRFRRRKMRDLCCWGEQAPFKLWVDPPSMVTRSLRICVSDMKQLPVIPGKPKKHFRSHSLQRPENPWDPPSLQPKPHEASPVWAASLCSMGFPSEKERVAGKASWKPLKRQKSQKVSQGAWKGTFFKNVWQFLQGIFKLLLSSFKSPMRHKDSEASLHSVNIIQASMRFQALAGLWDTQVLFFRDIQPSEGDEMFE